MRSMIKRGRTGRLRWRVLLWLSIAGCGRLMAEADELPKAAAEADRAAMAVEALSRLQGVDVNQNPKLKEAVLKLLEKTRGTANFVKLVRQFKLSDQDQGLLEVAVQNPANETGVEAMRMLLANQS